MRTIWKGLAHELRNVKISHTLGLYIPGLLFTSSHPLYAHEAPLLVHCWIRMASEYSPRSRCSCQFLDPWKRWKRLGECTKNSKFQIFQMWNLVLKNISNITIITTSIYPTMSAPSPNRPQHWFINNTNNRHHKKVRSSHQNLWDGVSSICTEKGALIVTASLNMKVYHSS